MSITKEKVLKPSLFKTAFLLIISLLFVYLGFYIMEKNNITAWFSIVFFGLCAIVFIIQLLPNASYLKLNNQGFEIKSLFKSNFTKWSDVEKFRSGYAGGRKMVMFNYTQTHKKYKLGKKMSKFVSGNEAGLPDSYGMKVKDLVDLMNDWKLKN